MSKGACFNHRRVTASELVDALADGGTDLAIERCIASDEIVIKGLEFGRLTITTTKFQQGLTFINCEFLDRVSLKNISSKRSISFIDCLFRGDVAGYHVTARDSLAVVKCRGDGVVHIDGARARVLDVQDLECNSLRVSSEAAVSALRSVKIDRAHCTDDVLLLGITDAADINIRALTTSNLSIERLTLPRGQLALLASHITTITFEDNDFTGATMECRDTTASRFYLLRSRTEDMQLVTERMIVTAQMCLLKCSYAGASIDVSGIHATNIELDPELTAFLDSRNTPTPLLHPQLPKTAHLETLKLLKDQFAASHLFQQEDMVFFRLKSLESTIAIANAGIANRAWLWLTRLIEQHVLGWGVRIRNPIIATLVLIEIFALGYFFKFGLYDPNESVGYLHHTTHGLAAANLLSLLAFFGQYGDVQTSVTSSALPLVAELACGILMTTVIVGIIIRKLTR